MTEEFLGHHFQMNSYLSVFGTSFLLISDTRHKFKKIKFFSFRFIKSDMSWIFKFFKLILKSILKNLKKSS